MVLIKNTHNIEMVKTEKLVGMMRIYWFYFKCKITVLTNIVLFKFLNE